MGVNTVPESKKILAPLQTKVNNLLHTLLEMYQKSVPVILEKKPELLEETFKPAAQIVSEFPCFREEDKQEVKDLVMQSYKGNIALFNLILKKVTHEQLAVWLDSGWEILDDWCDAGTEALEELQVDLEKEINETAKEKEEYLN